MVYKFKSKPTLYNGVLYRSRLEARWGGEASNFNDGILLISESSFKYPYPNCIGLTSLFGKIKNHKGEEDFEFCTSVVMDRYGEGLDIYNLCNGDEEILARYDTEQDFCSPLWNEAGNIVMFLKPGKSS